MARRGFYQHPVPSRIRRAVSDAVLHDVNVDARTQRLVAGFFGRTLHDLLNLEVGPIRVLLMEKRGCDPDLISYLDLCAQCSCHISSLDDSKLQCANDQLFLPAIMRLRRAVALRPAEAVAQRESQCHDRNLLPSSAVAIRL
jgi:hypothetical protein